ncbi:hypothetical protein J2S59_001179 [Nocardioides massiliensis]|uniref:HNH nuclease domain-containing protein n=1 Tax=Nocardioides massiliensis TaxID=1325935 RepID=A0ABT9NMV3_9ACTN|nr:HNH endonuclease signature motif containing protein [Nocardioides massiliensis]MDP9821370.1 hypothetical protein [Nocardioides massiliensis]
MLDRGDLENFGKAEAWETLRSNRATRDRLDVDDLLIADHLAGLYEAGTLAKATKAFRHDPERMVALAGEGAPILSEYAAGELSGHLRIPLQSARQLLGDAIEIAHRLPRLWQQMVEGKTEAWRVRAVAKETRKLSFEAASWVDAQLTHRLQKRKPNNAAPELVDEAIRRFDTELFAKREERRQDGRGVWLDPDTCQGLLRGVHMNLDAPDAELLDRTLDTIAAGLKAAGDTDDHQARRAKAVGTLLDPQLAMDFLNGTLPDTSSGGTTKTKSPGTTTRVANIYIHCSLADLAIMTSAGVDHGASIEKLGPITLARMGEWLTRPGGVGSGRIVLRPVIDTNTDQAVDQHDPPAWMREAMILRDEVCVFPGCTTTARACDADHIEPYVPLEDGGPPGQTSLANLAPLCRSHHRLKTHMGWTYQRRRDGTYAWRDRWGRPVRDDHDLVQSDARDLDPSTSSGHRSARSTREPSRSSDPATHSIVELYLHDFLIEYVAGPGGTDPPT